MYYDRYYLDYNDFKPKLYPHAAGFKASQKGEKGNAPIYLQERHKAKENKQPLEENKVKPRNSGFEEEEVKTRRPEPIKDQNNAIQQGGTKNNESKNAPILKENVAKKEAPKPSSKEEKRRLKEEKKKAKAEQRAREFEQRAREHQERDEKELEERRKALEMNKK
ncbi:plasminogen-binding pgbB domain protein [Helicobacter pylori Hp P-13]|nr:plasminogen-binding pgbB domain protein [Helicobacter pylori Hp P-13]